MCWSVFLCMHGGLDFVVAYQRGEVFPSFVCVHLSLKAHSKPDAENRSAKQDVAVPISRLAECIDATKKELDASFLHCPIVGHVGDGNFHVCICFDPKSEEESDEAKRLNRAMVVNVFLHVLYHMPVLPIQRRVSQHERQHVIALVLSGVPGHCYGRHMHRRARHRAWEKRVSSARVWRGWRRADAYAQAQPGPAQHHEPWKSRGYLNCPCLVKRRFPVRASTPTYIMKYGCRAQQACVRPF